MKNNKLNLLLSALIICVNAPFCAHAENISTPLFTADIRNVITMYAAPDAQTFYLHTEDSLYTVSRDGQILSIVPSRVKYGCCEDSVLYIHEEYDNYLLTQAGDTVFYAPYQDQNTGYGPSPSWLVNARFMCRKDGVFYWWKGIRSDRYTGDRGSCYYAVTEDGQCERIDYSVNGNLGITIIDNWLFISRQLGTDGILFGFSPISEFSTHDLLGKNTIKFTEFKYAIGLECVGDWLYIWSNGYQTMYTLPRSYLVEMATGIQNHYVDDEPSPLFDLQGRPVTQPQTGIYIHDGKKILIE